MLERLDVRAKAAAFGAVLVCVFTFTDPRANAVVLGLLLVALLAVRTALGGLGPMLRGLLPILIFIVVFTTLFSPATDPDPTVLMSVLGLKATLSGLLIGLNFAARIVILVVATYAITTTTSVDDVLEALSLAHAPNWFSIMIATAIAFVPTMGRKLEQIQQAQRARGAHIRSRGLGSVRSVIPIMVPLLTNSILMAEELAVALTNRGYGASGAMTSMRELRFRPADWALLGASALVAVGALWLRFGSQIGVL